MHSPPRLAHLFFVPALLLPLGLSATRLKNKLSSRGNSLSHNAIFSGIVNESHVHNVRALESGRHLSYIWGDFIGEVGLAVTPSESPSKNQIDVYINGSNMPFTEHVAFKYPFSATSSYGKVHFLSDTGWLMSTSNPEEETITFHPGTPLFPIMSTVTFRRKHDTDARLFTGQVPRLGRGDTVPYTLELDRALAGMKVKIAPESGGSSNDGIYEVAHTGLAERHDRDDGAFLSVVDGPRNKLKLLGKMSIPVAREEERKWGNIVSIDIDDHQDALRLLVRPTAMDFENLGMPVPEGISKSRK